MHDDVGFAFPLFVHLRMGSAGRRSGQNPGGDGVPCRSSRGTTSRVSWESRSAIEKRMLADVMHELNLHWSVLIGQSVFLVAISRPSQGWKREATGIKAVVQGLQHVACGISGRRTSRGASLRKLISMLRRLSDPAGLIWAVSSREVVTHIIRERCTKIYIGPRCCTSLITTGWLYIKSKVA